MFTLCGGYWWVRDLSVILLAYFEVLNVQKEKNCKYITSKLKKIRTPKYGGARITNRQNN